MLLVKTYLDRSTIHGVGLFAAQRIPKGTVLWRLNPLIDTQLSETQIASLTDAAREQIEKYTYRDRVLGTYVLCGDDARFFNHTENPNCLDLPDEQGGTTVAARDIEAGEELTCDYSAFDANFHPLQYAAPKR
jgi:SET domain-containing protein